MTEFSRIIITIMTKLQSHQVFAVMNAIKPVYLLTAAAVSCLMCINALRSNNIHMVQLRSAVYAADKSSGDVGGALTNLQRYVTSHMNTDLTPGRSAVYPPIQLRYTYERLQAAANQPVSNEQVYNDAQKYCEQQNSSDFSGRNRVPCIQKYVLSHGSQAKPKQIPDSLYKFDFISPSWSPDLAGWSVVTTVLLLLGAAISFMARRFQRS